MWWLLNFQIHSHIPFFLMPAPLTTGALHMEKEGSSWLQQRDICSEEVDWYKDFYVHTDERRTQKEMTEGKKEKEVPRISVTGKINRLPESLITCAF